MPGWGQLMDRVGKLTNLTYLGLQAQDTVNKVLAESHIFINTSEYEGFANTFIQAWMRGAPVLSLSVNPDNIFDDKTLGICAGGNFDQRRSELIDLINDEERRRRMELAVKLHARKNHGEENAAKLISLLTGRRE